MPVAGYAQEYPVVSMEQELGLRIWGGVFNPSMYDMRVNVDSQNENINGLSWKGGANSSSLELGPQGGADISWGLFPDVRIVLAGEVRGVSNKGSFVGKGVNDGGIASRNLYLSSSGGEVGLEILLKEYEKSARILFAARAGVHVLSGSRESWTENGPLGEFASTSRLSGTGVGGMVGLEWEMSFSERDGQSFSPGIFILAGYRFLTFNRIEYRYHDSNGSKDSGSVRDVNGNRVAIDMSGPDVRIGLQFSIPTK